MNRAQANRLKRAARDLLAMGEHELAHKVAGIADPFIGRRHFALEGDDGDGIVRERVPRGDIFRDLEAAPAPDPEPVT